MLMDEKDEKIVRILRKNARTPTTDIAKMVKMTEGAVRYRIKRLLNKKLIKKFTIVSDTEPTALIAVKTETKANAGKVSSDILKIDGVEKIYETSGEIDMVVLARIPYQNLNSVVDSIRKIPGIMSTTSYFILKERG